MSTQFVSSVLLDQHQIFPKESVPTFPCSSSSEGTDPDPAASDQGTPRSNKSKSSRTSAPVSTPERPTASNTATTATDATAASRSTAMVPSQEERAKEYGPSASVRRQNRQYPYQSLQSETTAGDKSPRVTALDFQLQPVKSLDIAGYGSLVATASAPAFVSDGEDDDEDGDNQDEEDDSLVGTSLNFGGRGGDAAATSTASDPADEKSPSSPLLLADKAAAQPQSQVNNSNDEVDADAFLNIQNKRFESMKALGEMAVPGSSQTPAPPTPPPIKTIEIATSSARPTTGEGYFSFILSAATASNEAAAGSGGGGGGGNATTVATAPLSPASPDELMDVDDDGSDSSDGFSDLGVNESASVCSHVGCDDSALPATATAAIMTPASNDELMSYDDGSSSDDFSDLDDNDDEDGDVSPTNVAAKGKHNSITWRDESKKHEVQAHQYHRTRGNIAMPFRPPKFFPDFNAPQPPTPSSAQAEPSPAAAVVGGSATQVSAVKSPLSVGSVSPMMTSASSSPTKGGRPEAEDPYPNKYSFAVISSSAAAGAAVVSSDIAQETDSVDEDYSSPVSTDKKETTETAKGKKGWKKSLGKLKMSRKNKKKSSKAMEDTPTSAQGGDMGYAAPTTEKHGYSGVGIESYDMLYDDDSDIDDGDDLACPPNLEMPGITGAAASSSASPSATSTALVVLPSQATNYKAHQTRPDLDKFRDPEANQKKLTPFSMWYDDEEDLVGCHGKDSSDETAESLALVPSPGHKSQSVAKMLAAFLSRGSKCASAAAVVYDTDSDADDDSSAGSDDEDDDMNKSRVGISRPTGCLWDKEEDAYGGGRDGVMDQGTDQVLNHLVTGPLQGYMTGLSPDALENKDVKPIERTVHKHTSEAAESPVSGWSRSQYNASGMHTTTYSTVSLLERGVDMAGVEGMKVYRLEGTGSGTRSKEGGDRDAPTHTPSPPESHPPTREEQARSMAGTGASSIHVLQAGDDDKSPVDAGTASARRPGQASKRGRVTKTPKSVLMSSVACSALLNEDTIYDEPSDGENGSDDGSAPRSSALIEYKRPTSASGSALGPRGSRALAIPGLPGVSIPKSTGPAAPSTRAVTVSSKNALTVVSEGVGSTAPTTKIFVLLLQPRLRLFELAQLVYYPSVATIGDLVDLIPSNATEPLLGNQAYVGLCRPKDKGQMSILTDLDLMASGAVEGGSANIYRGEILVAIPEGYSGEQCAKMAKPILANQEFSKLMSRSDPLAPNTERS